MMTELDNAIYASSARCSPKCSSCGSRKIRGDFDPDVGHWLVCENCDYKWSESEGVTAMTTVGDYIESIRKSLDEVERGTDPPDEPGDNLRQWLSQIDDIAKQASRVFGLKE